MLNFNNHISTYFGPKHFNLPTTRICYFVYDLVEYSRKSSDIPG